MSSHSKSQSHVHAAGIVLHRGVNELLDLGKVDYLIKLLFNLRLLHAQYGAVQIDVFSPGQFRVEAGAHFQKGTHPTVNLGLSFCWFGNAGKNLEKCSLARSIAPDDAHHLAPLDLKGDVFERPDGLV